LDFRSSEERANEVERVPWGPHGSIMDRIGCCHAGEGRDKGINSSRWGLDPFFFFLVPLFFLNGGSREELLEGNQRRKKSPIEISAFNHVDL
jgi:hypothetical protein